MLHHIISTCVRFLKYKYIIKYKICIECILHTALERIQHSTISDFDPSEYKTLEIFQSKDLTAVVLAELCK